MIMNLHIENLENLLKLTSHVKKITSKRFTFKK